MADFGDYILAVIPADKNTGADSFRQFVQDEVYGELAGNTKNNVRVNAVNEGVRGIYVEPATPESLALYKKAQEKVQLEKERERHGREDGLCEQKPGKTELSKPELKLDENGRAIAAKYATGLKGEFAYDEFNNLAEVQLGQTHWFKLQDGRWQVNTADQVPKVIDADVKVDAQGTLKVKIDQTTRTVKLDGTRITEFSDGSQAISYPDGSSVNMRPDGKVYEIYFSNGDRITKTERADGKPAHTLWRNDPPTPMYFMVGALKGDVQMFANGSVIIKDKSGLHVYNRDCTRIDVATKK